MRSIVNGLLVREGSVLLAKRAPLSDAIVGELREEIGITPTAFISIDLVADPNMPASNPTTYHMYCIFDWEGGEPAILGDEHSELAWMPFEVAASVPDLALQDYRALLKKLSALNHLYPQH